MLFLCFFLLSRILFLLFFFFSSRRRHTRLTCDWSSDVCSSDLDELRIRIEEATDEPGAGRPIDVAMLASRPPHEATSSNEAASSSTTCCASSRSIGGK